MSHAQPLSHGRAPAAVQWVKRRRVGLGHAVGVNHWVGPVRDFESLAKRRARGWDGLGGSSGPESAPCCGTFANFDESAGMASTWR